MQREKVAPRLDFHRFHEDEHGKALNYLIFVPWQYQKKNPKNFCLQKNHVFFLQIKKEINPQAFFWMELGEFTSPVHDDLSISELQITLVHKGFIRRHFRSNFSDQLGNF